MNWNIIWTLQIFSTVFMTGLIWVIQLVHYPIFLFAEKKQFSHLHAFHSKRITYIVAPLMLLELCCAIMLLKSVKIVFILRVLNLLSVVMIWFVTAFLNIPRHNKLAIKYSAVEIQKLVRSNWPRTFLWSLRSLVFLVVFISDVGV